MRRKDLWQKVATDVDCAGKQYKYLYRRMLEDNVIRKAYKKLRKGKARQSAKKSSRLTQTLMRKLLA